MPNSKRLLSAVPFYACVLLLAYMPFHVFLVQWLSTFTGGLSVWKVAKDAMIALGTVFVICLVIRQGKLNKTFEWLLGLTVLYGLLHLILWVTHPDIYRPSAILGVTYNLRVPCFALIGYGAALLRPDLFKRISLIKVTIWAGTIVAALGVIQYFLPSDFLTHFGYSVARGVKPNFFIDDKPNLPRIMSTLRDPNSLGAYLIVPMTLLVAEITQAGRMFRVRILYIAAWLTQFGALWLTFSRSALLAAALSIALFLVFQYWHQGVQIAKRFWLPLAFAVVLLTGGLFMARNSYFEKSVISHHTGAPKAQYDSNGFHWFFVQRGIKGIVHDPLGHGPGTAGLASIQNPKGSFLTENYYVQIGYEAGIVGLAIFIALNMFVYSKLFAKRTNDITVALLASFWAYVLMNMLLHTWSNEAVACQWWILAGVIMALPAAKNLKPTRSKI